MPGDVTGDVLLHRQSSHGFCLILLRSRADRERRGQGRVQGERLEREGFCAMSGDGYR